MEEILNPFPVIPRSPLRAKCQPCRSEDTAAVQDLGPQR